MIGEIYMGEVIHVNFKKPSLDQASIEKLKYFEELLGQGKTDTILDARASGVAVPAEFRKNPALLLAWSHQFGIEDFEYDEEGVRGTLSFQKKLFYVNIPWKSVWMISQSSDPEESSRAWKESMPKSIGELFLDR